MQIESKKIFFILSFFIFSSCGIFPPKWVATLKEKGIRQPVRESYHLSKEQFVFDTLIDTNAVYLNSEF